MCSNSLATVGDRDLLERLRALVERDRATTAELLAHIGEVDARRLYVPAAYPSMYLYCVHELRLSEDSALKRIQAARAARQFPVLFEAVAQGRLHLSGVVLLAPYLTTQTWTSSWPRQRTDPRPRSPGGSRSASRARKRCR